MGHVLVFLLLAAAALGSVARPWVGAVYAYLFVVLTPQDIWYWDFVGLRPVMWVLLPTCLGTVFALARRQLDFSIVGNRRNAFILILWLCVVLSYYLGPYTSDPGPYRFENAATTLDTMNKIFLLYFVASICIDTERKLWILFCVIAGSAIYLVYWANDQYLTGHVFGRLAGPTDVDGTGMYADENSFAMLFVVAQSFLWYLGASFKRAAFRWGFWLIIPFCWHAVFLTGSRGGLIGLAVTTLLISLRSKRRVLGLALIPAFIFVYVWQAGSLMKSRADTIDQFETDTSAASRLESWKAAAGMIADHPLTGVGLASFGPAFPYYSNKHPHEAHDTFLQIAAESGVLAGLMYLMIVVCGIVPLWKSCSRMKKRDVDIRSNRLFIASEATLIGLCGLFVCSLFLSLQEFEIFYCLNVLTNAALYLSRKSLAAEGADSSKKPVEPVAMLEAR